jgi:hypothetical protein
MASRAGEQWEKSGEWTVCSGQFSWERIIVLVLVLVHVLVHVHDSTFAFTSSCTENVYRCAVNGYDLPASWASGEKVGSGQCAVFLGGADCSTDIPVCARLLSKVGTALRSGPPVVAGNQNCFDSGLGADLIDRIDHIEIASLPRRFWKNAPYPNSLSLIPRLQPCAVASRASGEKVGSGQCAVFLGGADCSTDITVCARLLSKVGTALRSGPEKDC